MRGDAAPALPQAACGSSASGMIEHEERKREAPDECLPCAYPCTQCGRRPSDVRRDERRFVATQLQRDLVPFLQRQAGDALELADVVGDENGAVGKCRCGYEQVVGAYELVFSL